VGHVLGVTACLTALETLGRRTHNIVSANLFLDSRRFQIIVGDTNSCLHLFDSSIGNGETETVEIARQLSCSGEQLKQCAPSPLLEVNEANWTKGGYIHRISSSTVHRR
jgi:hypothetical protein